MNKHVVWLIAIAISVVELACTNQTKTASNAEISAPEALTTTVDTDNTIATITFTITSNPSDSVAATAADAVPVSYTVTPSGCTKSGDTVFINTTTTSLSFQVQSDISGIFCLTSLIKDNGANIVPNTTQSCNPVLTDGSISTTDGEIETYTLIGYYKSTANASDSVRFSIDPRLKAKPGG